MPQQKTSAIPPSRISSLSTYLLGLPSATILFNVLSTYLGFALIALIQNSLHAPAMTTPKNITLINQTALSTTNGMAPLSQEQPSTTVSANPFAALAALTTLTVYGSFALFTAGYIFFYEKEPREVAHLLRTAAYTAASANLFLGPITMAFAAFFVLNTSLEAGGLLAGAAVLGNILLCILTTAIALSAKIGRSYAEKKSSTDAESQTSADDASNLSTTSIHLFSRSEDNAGQSPHPRHRRTQAQAYISAVTAEVPKLHQP